MCERPLPNFVAMSGHLPRGSPILATYSISFSSSSVVQRGTTLPCRLGRGIFDLLVLPLPPSAGAAAAEGDAPEEGIATTVTALTAEAGAADASTTASTTTGGLASSAGSAASGCAIGISSAVSTAGSSTAAGAEATVASDSAMACRARWCW
jgi:hypothetical protein